MNNGENKKPSYFYSLNVRNIHTYFPSGVKDVPIAVEGG